MGLIANYLIIGVGESKPVPIAATADIRCFLHLTSSVFCSDKLRKLILAKSSELVKDHVIESGNGTAQQFATFNKAKAADYLVEQQINLLFRIEGVRQGKFLSDVSRLKQAVGSKEVTISQSALPRIQLMTSM